MSSSDQRVGEALFTAGLLQFGRFVHRGETRPFQHHLAMLASYPPLLRELAAAMGSQLSGVDRLLTTVGSLPLAVPVGLATDIPLVIAVGDGHDGARDFIGAYDIGHPAALITGAFDDFPAGLLPNARRFGLEVDRICAVLEVRPVVSSVPAQALVTLNEFVVHLVASKQLPAGQGRAVQAWLAAPPNRPHPG